MTIGELRAMMPPEDIVKLRHISGVRQEVYRAEEIPESLWGEPVRVKLRGVGVWFVQWGR